MNILSITNMMLGTTPAIEQSKKVFLELLQCFVKAGWVEKIDESTTLKVDKSYITPDFSSKEADLVYRIKLKNQDVIFYLLMEL